MELPMETIALLNSAYRMLYKMGLMYKRQDYYKDDIMKIADESLSKHKFQVKQSFDEVNEFIQTFH